MTTERIYYSREAEMLALRNRAILTAVFLTFGLGIGAGLALLFAPASGVSTRHELAQSLEDGLNSGRESVEPLIKRLEKEFAELRKQVEDRLK